jgi:uncharacterized protein (TIGR02145 family)
MKTNYINQVLEKRSITPLVKILLCVLFMVTNELQSVQAQTVTDIDGNVYNSVTISTQIWLKENLKTTRYSNGDLIGTTIPASLDITAETNPKYQWAYNGEENNVAIYGRLYSWDAVADSRNLCPDGWHAATDPEWTILTDFLGGEDIAGSKLKEAGTVHWTTPNTDATNETGFTALPGGQRYSHGLFLDMGDIGHWWSASFYNSTNAWWRSMYSVNSFEIRSYFDDRGRGKSVRCMKDLATAVTNPSESMIKIYPNPVSGILKIEYKDENFEIVIILNSQGGVLSKEKVVFPRQQIDFSRYTPGLYFLEFVKTSGEVKRVKVVNQ